MGETRKLAAILVADVVGYNRLAGADGERTLARLSGLRSDLIDRRSRQSPACIRQLRASPKHGGSAAFVGMPFDRGHHSADISSRSLKLLQERHYLIPRRHH